MPETELPFEFITFKFLMVKTEMPCTLSAAGVLVKYKSVKVNDLLGAEHVISNTSLDIPALRLVKVRELREKLLVVPNSINGEFELIELLVKVLEFIVKLVNPSKLIKPHPLLSLIVS